LPSVSTSITGAEAPADRIHRGSGREVIDCDSTSSARAKAKGSELNDLINALLKRDIELIEIAK
jgi:hypothetical protein